MAKAIDLTGQNFGYLYVIERDYEAQQQHPNERQAWWKCKCKACGKIKSFRSSVVKKSNSCGCVRNYSQETIDKLIARNKKMGEEKRDNLVGRRFSRLLVLEYADEQHQIYYNTKHQPTWKCQCDCGNICYVTSDNLKRGYTPSCGCITKENRRKELNDLTGQRFGHLEVIKYIGTINGNSKYWVKCDCGKEYEVYASNLTQGCTTSCGCTKESHGEQKIREILIKNNINFISQKTFNNFYYPDTHGKPRFDFFLPDYNILIEYDGEQHFKPAFNWDTDEKYKQRLLHDRIKNEYAWDNNFIIIRIPFIHYNSLTLNDLLINSNFIRKDDRKCQTRMECASQHTL